MHLQVLNQLLCPAHKQRERNENIEQNNHKEEKLRLCQKTVLKEHNLTKHQNKFPSNF